MVRRTVQVQVSDIVGVSVTALVIVVMLLFKKLLFDSIPQETGAKTFSVCMDIYSEESKFKALSSEFIERQSTVIAGSP